jgi:hypothetical protein
MFAFESNVRSDVSQSMLHSSLVNLASDCFHCLRCAVVSTCVKLFS